MSPPTPAAPTDELHEARLRDLAHRINEAELVVALDGRIAEANDRASITRSMTDTAFFTDLDLRLIRSVTTDESLLGYTPAEFVGLRPSERFEVEFLDGNQAALFARLMNLQPVRTHLRLKRKDGTRMEADATVTPVLDAAGEANGFVTILRDITAQKDAERALQKSEAQLRATLATMAEGLVVQDAHGHIVT